MTEKDKIALKDSALVAIVSIIFVLLIYGFMSLVTNNRYQEVFDDSVKIRADAVIVDGRVFEGSSYVYLTRRVADAITETEITGYTLTNLTEESGMPDTRVGINHLLLVKMLMNHLKDTSITYNLAQRPATRSYSAGIGIFSNTRTVNYTDIFLELIK